MKFNEFVKMNEGKTPKNVCIFPGRFQPFHNGHIAALERTSKEFKCPVIPIQIVSKNEKSPIPVSLLEKMGNAIVNEFSFIEKYVLYPQSEVTALGAQVKYVMNMGYNVIGVGAGSDRLKSYESSIKYLLSDKSDVAVDKNLFHLFNADTRNEEGPSGTKVRQSILDKDEATFKKMVPKSLYKFWDDLQKVIITNESRGVDFSKELREKISDCEGLMNSVIKEMNEHGKSDQKMKQLTGLINLHSKFLATYKKHFTQ